MIDDKLLQLRSHSCLMNSLLSGLRDQIEWMERRFKAEERDRILKILEQYDFGFMYDTDSELMKEIESN